jgi:hypothetical protein
MHPINLLDMRHTPPTVPRWLGSLYYATTLVLLSPRNPLRHHLPDWLVVPVVGQGWAFARELALSGH